MISSLGQVRLQSSQRQFPCRQRIPHVAMHPLTGMPVERNDSKPGAYLDGSWTFALHEFDGQTTRLIERVRADYRPRLWIAPLVPLLMEPAL